MEQRRGGSRNSAYTYPELLHAFPFVLLDQCILRLFVLLCRVIWVTFTTAEPLCDSLSAAGVLEIGTDTTTSGSGRAAVGVLAGSGSQ